MEYNTLSSGEKFFQEVRTATFRKEEFSYIHTGIIDESGEKWTTTEMDEANIFQVYNQYRLKHGIPFPDDISGIREHYGLSAAKMSQILGFGINQYRMYEDGEVPSVSNARTIIAAREKDVFMTFVEASKSEMSEQEYLRIKGKVEAADGDYKPVGEPSEYTGFRLMSLDKIADIVHVIIDNIGATFVTKMNKLLFYADFIHYKKHGYGLTGIKYRALPYGPVPDRWGSLYTSLSGINMEEFVYPSGQSGVRLEAIENTKSVLNDAECDTIKTVCELFAGMSAGEISRMSHLEKGWIENKDTRAAISYQDAFALNSTCYTKEPSIVSFNVEDLFEERVFKNGNRRILIRELNKEEIEILCKRLNIFRYTYANQCFYLIVEDGKIDQITPSQIRLRLLRIIESEIESSSLSREYQNTFCKKWGSLIALSLIKLSCPMVSPSTKLDHEVGMCVNERYRELYYKDKLIEYLRDNCYAFVKPESSNYGYYYKKISDSKYAVVDIVEWDEENVKFVFDLLEVICRNGSNILSLNRCDQKFIVGHFNIFKYRSLIDNLFQKPGV